MTKAGAIRRQLNIKHFPFITVISYSRLVRLVILYVSISQVFCEDLTHFVQQAQRIGCSADLYPLRKSQLDIDLVSDMKNQSDHNMAIRVVVTLIELFSPGSWTLEYPLIAAYKRISF